MIRKVMASIAALTALVPLAHAEGTQTVSGWSLLNMTQGVTDISRRIYGLHMLIFWVCVIIGAVVFGVMIWSLIVFRKSKGAVADTTLVHNTKVEIVWTAIPVIILIAMAVPAAKTLVVLEDTRGTELTIKVTGFQWGWQYDYLDDGVVFFSRLDRKSDEARHLLSGIDPNTIEHYLLNVDNPLIVPAGAKVRLLVTGADVIHSWWVPAFGMKKDAIPGYVNEMWFNVDADKTGVYRGQCVELCGRDHGFMPIVVDVRSKENFQQWLKTTAEQQKQAAAPQPAAPAIAAPAAPAAAALAVNSAAAG
ncbi:MAG TPA: cytochrome c oxidase subunit II [Steroidobacteraceae bacterium]|nr:cytochrome c oxidase subunit II [Steroidobacteraceae bacterium]